MSNWLAQLAPTVASALGGPLAGLAVSAVAKAIGVDEKKAQDLLETGKMDANQIAQVKVAELELQKQAEALGLDFEKLAVEDRKSARQMQVETKSWVPPVMAMAVTFGFFGILLSLMLGYAHKSDELLMMLGSLGTAWTGIIAFYFGSSAGSQRKDELLHKSSPTS